MIDRAYLANLVMSPIYSWGFDEQRRFNHEGCSAGEDTRERLYVKHRGVLEFVAYCHNCGEAGYVRIGAKLHERDDVASDLAKMFKPEEGTVPVDTIVSANFKLPDDRRGGDWDGWAVAWAWKCHTDRDSLTQLPYVWSYSPSLDRIIQPVFKDDQTMLYQARGKPGADPKTLTIINSEVGVKHPLVYEGSQGMPIFVVEDPMSAHRIHYHGHSTAVALLGTHANSEAVATILKLAEQTPHRPVIIWLDNDMAGITGEVALTRTLHPLMPVGGKLSNIHNPKEPKHYTTTELAALVTQLTRDRS